MSRFWYSPFYKLGLARSRLPLHESWGHVWSFKKEITLQRTPRQSLGRQNPFFDNWLRNYDVTWWFFVKTDITIEFSVVDLVKTDSYSPVSSKFEKQSRMCFDQIHIKPTFYRPLKDVLLSHVTSSRLFKYKFWKPSKNAIRWYASIRNRLRRPLRGRPIHRKNWIFEEPIIFVELPNANGNIIRRGHMIWTHICLNFYQNFTSRFYLENFVLEIVLEYSDDIIFEFYVSSNMSHNVLLCKTYSDFVLIFIQRIC